MQQLLDIMDQEFLQPDDADLIHEQEEHTYVHVPSLFDIVLNYWSSPHSTTFPPHRFPMSRSNPQQILNSLASSPNDFAAGIALCIKALADATASPPTSPIMVEYRNRRMAFGRRHLARLGGHVSFRLPRYHWL